MTPPRPAGDGERIVLHMRRDLRPWRLAYWRFRLAMRSERKRWSW